MTGLIDRTVVSRSIALPEEADRRLSLLARQQQTTRGKVIAELIFSADKEQTSIITWNVTGIDRSRTPREVLDATGRGYYIKDGVINGMPRGEGEEVDLYFFELDRCVSDDELENEYKLHGLVPADPYSLAKHNEDNPEFADTYPNITYWKDEGGNLWFMNFDGSGSQRSVDVSRSDGGLGVDWLCVGLRK